jgi:hypothetical protein
MAIVGEERPDFRTISAFRQQHVEAWKAPCVPVGRWAGEAGLVKRGNVSTAGTTVQGNASRHQAMRYGYRKQEVTRLREAIEAIVTQAHQQDEAEEAVVGSRRGDALPAALAHRAPRLATLAWAMRRLAAQATHEAEAERQRRAEAAAERQRTGQPRRGNVPQAVDERPADKAQRSCTDPEWHIMQRNPKDWDYCGHAQARVDGAWQIMLACDVVEAPNDTPQAEPMAEATLATVEQAGIDRPTADPGTPQPIPATWASGSSSEAAAQALKALGCAPYRATGRTRHQAEPAASPESPSTAKAPRAAKGQSPAGRVVYAKRKVIVEPVFGQSKEGRGFRRFLWRGMQKLRGAGRLVCLTHNLLKLWRYGCMLVAT